MDMEIIARAFELAKAGSCRSVEDIERKLTTENYDGIFQHLAAPGLRRELRHVMATRKRKP